MLLNGSSVLLLYICFTSDLESKCCKTLELCHSKSKNLVNTARRLACMSLTNKKNSFIRGKVNKESKMMKLEVEKMAVKLNLMTL